MEPEAVNLRKHGLYTFENTKPAAVIMYNEGYKRKEYGYGERNISFEIGRRTHSIFVAGKTPEIMGALIATVVVGVIIALFGLKIVKGVIGTCRTSCGEQLLEQR